MSTFYVIGAIVIAIISLIFSILGFSGKGIILDDAYLKASREERKTMDKHAYCLQGAIIFLLIFVATVCNLLRVWTYIPLFTYIAIGIGLIGIIYVVVSHYTLKKKRK